MCESWYHIWSRSRSRPRSRGLHHGHGHGPVTPGIIESFVHAAREVLAKLMGSGHGTVARAKCAASAPCSQSFLESAMQQNSFIQSAKDQKLICKEIS
jgi:hypothetical protein